MCQNTFFVLLNYGSDCKEKKKKFTLFPIDKQSAGCYNPTK